MERRAHECALLAEGKGRVLRDEVSETGPRWVRRPGTVAQADSDPPFPFSKIPSMGHHLVKLD
jgi:hypothetical protein